MWSIYNTTTTFQAELHGVTNTIEMTSKKKWSRLWLETDS